MGESNECLDIGPFHRITNDEARTTNQAIQPQEGNFLPFCHPTAVEFRKHFRFGSIIVESDDVVEAVL
jgi:hypothetical protein